MKFNRTATLLVTLATAVIGQAQTYVAKEVSTGGYANAISAGLVAGSFANRAVVWNEGVVKEMQPKGYTYSTINDVRGSLCVGYAGTAAALSQRPFSWFRGSASMLPVPFAYVYGQAVATDGTQIVGMATEGDAERGVGASHAVLWNVSTGQATDLGRDSSVYGVGGGVQVGTRIGSRGATAGLWRGTENSFVDLHVQGNDASVATDTNGTIQVGYVGIDVRVRNEGRPRDIRFYTAGYWTGSADSFTALPSNYRHSFATDVKGDTIAGYGNTTDAIGTPLASHAVAWIGETRNFVDLHALLPADMKTSRATGIDERGNIVGYGITFSGVLRSFVWLRL